MIEMTFVTPELKKKDVSPQNLVFDHIKINCYISISNLNEGQKSALKLPLQENLKSELKNILLLLSTTDFGKAFRFSSPDTIPCFINPIVINQKHDRSHTIRLSSSIYNEAWKFPELIYKFDNQLADIYKQVNKNMIKDDIHVSAFLSMLNATRNTSHMFVKRMQHTVFIKDSNPVELLREAYNEVADTISDKYKFTFSFGPLQKIQLTNLSDKNIFNSKANVNLYVNTSKEELEALIPKEVKSKKKKGNE